MAEIIAEESIEEEILTEYNRKEENTDVILESIDKDDLSSVGSIPEYSDVSTKQTYSIQSSIDSEDQRQSTSYTTATDDVDPRGGVANETVTARSAQKDKQSTWKQSSVEARYSTESFETLTSETRSSRSEQESSINEKDDKSDSVSTLDTRLVCI